MLTKTEYEQVKARLTAEMAWVDSIRGRNGWASYRPEDKPAGVPTVSNEERSAVEVYEFITNPPERAFVYIKEDGTGSPFSQEHYRTGEPCFGEATTWTGENLGHVAFGRAYKSGFGDTRVPVTVRAVNGKTYHGTYYKSAGNYARVRMVKGKVGSHGQA